MKRSLCGVGLNREWTHPSLMPSHRISSTNPFGFFYTNSVLLKAEWWWGPLSPVWRLRSPPLFGFFQFPPISVLKKVTRGNSRRHFDLLRPLFSGLPLPPEINGVPNRLVEVASVACLAQAWKINPQHGFFSRATFPGPGPTARTIPPLVGPPPEANGPGFRVAIGQTQSWRSGPTPDGMTFSFD